MFNSDTALEDRVRAQLPMGNYTYLGGPGTNHGPQPTQSIHDQHVLGINAIFSGYVQITPFYGKIAFFSSLFVNYDLYVNGGIGFVNYIQNACCTPVPGNYDPKAHPDPNVESAAQFAGLKVGGQIGVGAHIYFNEWFGLQFELRDYIVGANPGGFDTDGNRVLNSADEGPQNNIFFGFGLTFMLPPSARVSR
jgi:outer membrane beta-barrel protein